MTTFPSYKPLVMVSSVVKGFEDYRDAARHGIEAAGGRPVLVNEDFPSIAASSRNVCLDAVAASDVYVGIIGDRGGWTTPSGKLAVEEEFEEAVRLRKPILVFIQDGVTRDEPGSRLAKRWSDYVTGYFRATFTTPDDLLQKVQSALAEPFRQLTLKPMPTTTLTTAFSERPKVQQSPSLRVVLSPAREQELVDPTEIETDDFALQVLEIAHSRAVRLLDYAQATRREAKGDALVITASDERGAIKSFMEVHESGLVVLDLAVEREQGNMGFSFIIAEETIEAVLGAALRFCGELYGWKDPYGRNQEFLFNCALLGMEHYSIERAPQPRSSYVMPTSGTGPLLADEAARTIGRHDLAHPDDEVKRALVKLNRVAKTGR